MKIYLPLFLCTLVLWISCNGQTAPTSKSDPHEEQIAQGDISDEVGSNIMVIHQDSRNHYWFGSWKTGVYRYDGKTVTNFTTEHGLASNRVDEIKEDADGNIYITSCHPKSVISKYDGKKFTTLSPTPSTEWKLQSTDVWLKYAYQNEKVYRYDGETLHELRLPKPPHLSNPFEIYSIYKDQKGNLWFGTNPVGVCRYDGASFDWITEEDVTEFRDEGANGVRSIAEDKQGDFWFNTEYRYTIYGSTSSERDTFYKRHKSIGSLDGKADGELDEYLSTVRDNEDHLWFVTYLDGVWKYDGTAVTHYPMQQGGKNMALFHIYKDHTGDLWLGTQENGVYKYNGTTFEKFTP